MKKIIDEFQIVARDQNKVFVERADHRKLSPMDAIQKYGLGPGKGRACVEFDVEPQILGSQWNKETKCEEWFIRGNIDLSNRNPKGYVNF